MEMGARRSNRRRRRRKRSRGEGGGRVGWGFQNHGFLFCTVVYLPSAFFCKPFKFPKNYNVFQSFSSGGGVKGKRKIEFGFLNLQHGLVKPQTKSK